MRKQRKLQSGIFLLAAIFFVGCQTRGTLTEEVKKVQKKERSVNYRDIAVPEEGGIKFTKFTDESEDVMGPWIRSDEGIISWWTPSLIAISPDGSKVAYTAERDGKTNIFIKNTQGGRSTIQRTFRENVVDMAYSPDGKLIIFTERVDDDYNILQINATEGAAIQQISSTSARESGPIYAPNGKQIYYTQAEYVSNLSDYRYYLWSIDRNSSLKTQYSEGFNPAISPSNPNLVVVCRNNRATGKGEIFSINLQSGQETLILSNPDMGFSSPQISPDGKLLLFVGTTLGSSKRKENLDIYTIRMDGTKLTQLTFHPGHDVSPMWSPEGDKIYMLCQRGNIDGAWDVWKIDYEAK